MTQQNDSAAIDQNVLKSAILGERQAVDEVLVASWPPAFRIAFSILRDRQLAEDAAQDACATVLIKIRSLRDPSAFASWFWRIAYNAALQIRRKRTRENQNAHAARIEIPTDSVGLDVRSAIESLPDDLRVAIYLRYVEDLPGEVVAKALGIPHGTLRYRLSVARKRISAALSGETTPLSQPKRMLIKCEEL